jgi:hypothetical protein
MGRMFLRSFSYSFSMGHNPEEITNHPSITEWAIIRSIVLLVVIFPIL